MTVFKIGNWFIPIASISHWTIQPAAPDKGIAQEFLTIYLNSGVTLPIYGDAEIKKVQALLQKGGFGFAVEA